MGTQLVSRVSAAFHLFLFSQYNSNLGNTEVVSTKLVCDGGTQPWLPDKFIAWACLHSSQDERKSNGNTKINHSFPFMAQNCLQCQ